jgi:hypothetical protein
MSHPQTTSHLSLSQFLKVVPLAKDVHFKLLPPSVHNHMRSEICTFLSHARLGTLVSIFSLVCHYNFRFHSLGRGIRQCL